MGSILKGHGRLQLHCQAVPGAKQNGWLASQCLELGSRTDVMNPHKLAPNYAGMFANQIWGAVDVASLAKHN